MIFNVVSFSGESESGMMDSNEKLSPITSLSYSDCLPDLLCCEEAGILVEKSPEYSLDLEFQSDIEESIAGILEEEGDYVPGFDYSSRFHSQSLDASARADSVAWIRKVHARYRFQPLTMYLSVNYMDRFLSSRSLPQTNGWPLQLLSVACLSLAAKMEEALVPSLLDLQVEDAKFIFEPRTIRRMELLILTVLDWRLRSITPFNFINYFACKIDSTRTSVRFLISRATQIILAAIQEITFLDYWPSSMAAAAILCAAHEIPNLSLTNPGKVMSWCHGLNKERVINCYHLMQEFIVVDNTQRKPPKVLPPLRVTTRTRTRSSDSSSSSSSSPNIKKRKLNHF